MRKTYAGPARLLGLGAMLLSVACAEPIPGIEDRIADLQGLAQEEAWPEIQEAAAGLLEELEAGQPDGSIEAALVIDLLLESQRRMGHPIDREGLGLAQRAVEIKERFLGPTDFELVASLKNLAVALRDDGAYSGAIDEFERALLLQESASPSGDLATADTLNQLGWSYYLDRRFDEAESAYQRGLGIRESTLGPNHEDVAASLNNLAILLKNLGDYSDARALLERAQVILESNLGPDDRRVGAALGNLAMVLKGQGALGEAKVLYQRSLDIMERNYGENSRQIAPTLQNLTVLYRDMGDVATATELSSRTLAILEQEFGPDHPRVASALQNEGVLQYDARNYEVAEQNLMRALKLREELFSPEHTVLATTLTSLAAVYTELGDFDRATAAVDRALQIREASVDHNDRGVAKTLRTKAALLERQGDFAEAIGLLDRARSIYEARLTRDHPEVATVLERLGRLTAALGQPIPALDYALEADRIGREYLRLNARLLTENDALRYAATRPSGQDTALSLAVEPGVPIETVWDAVVRSRALVLDELRARHGSSAKTGELAAELARATERLSNVLVQGAEAADPSRYLAVLTAARKELEAVEEAFARMSAEFRQRRSSASIGIEEVMIGLPADSSLVAYIVYKHARIGAEDRVPHRRYAAMVANHAQAAPRFVGLGPAEEIEQRVREWRQAVRKRPAAIRAVSRTAERDYRETARRLREALWDPVADLIGNSRRVFVVPDGALHFVSLATLPGTDGGYLVDGGLTFQYLNAERDLVSLEPRNAGGVGLLLLADPDFGSRTEVPPADDCVADLSNFAPLPGSLREAKEVAALWRDASGAEGREPVSIVTRSEASEFELDRLGPGRRILHLATHGFVVDQGCTTGLAWDTLRRTAASSPRSVQSLAGLALAGANSRGSSDGRGDGILTAAEITALNLTGVEWVVLSGCDTGLGEIRSGEGVLGLRRAFEIAGAATVITSLWPVDDGASSAWMRRLYEHRLAGATSIDAVTYASRRTLASRRENGLDTHPFHWGAYVSFGDWR